MKNVLTIWVALAAASCGTDTRGSPTTQAAEAYLLEDTAVVSIGGHDDREEYQLQYTVGAVRLSDGRIVIADAGSRNLRYYDDSGQHLHTAGRSGEGPGEFRNLRWVARMRDDTIAAWDVRQRRISVFDPKGNFVLASALTGLADLATVPREPPLSFSAVQMTANGDVITEALPEYNLSRFEEPHVTHDTVPLFAFDRSGGHAKLLGHFPASQAFLYRRSGYLLRFGNMLLIAAARDFVWVGSSADGVLRAVTVNGDTLHTVTARFDRRPIRAADVPPPATGVSAQARNAMPVPDSMPLLSAARVSADERLWVQKYRAPLDERQEWVALGTAGEVLATLTMDAAMDVLDIGPDYVLVLTRDDFDVQEVQLRRFRPRT